MTLGSFQQALVDLTLAPENTRRLIRGDVSVLDVYNLTEGEVRRLIDVVQQPGMSVNCSLARGNRFEAIGEVFPMTCVLLEPILKDLLAELWDKVRPTNYQFAGEDTAFANAVKEKLETKAISIPYLDEVFQYECLCLNMAHAMRTQADPDHEANEVMEFKHPPDLLLEPLSRLEAPPDGLPSGSYRARLTLRQNRFYVEMV